MIYLNLLFVIGCVKHRVSVTMITHALIVAHHDLIITYPPHLYLGLGVRVEAHITSYLRDFASVYKVVHNIPM